MKMLRNEHKPGNMARSGRWCRRPTSVAPDGRTFHLNPKGRI
jgi:hypothetical protein